MPKKNPESSFSCSGDSDEHSDSSSAGQTVFRIVKEKHQKAGESEDESSIYSSDESTGFSEKDETLSPEKDETHLSSPEKDETSLSPEKDETPLTSPEKDETPSSSPEKDETPSSSPEKDETPSSSPEKDETPSSSPEKDETPSSSPGKDETPSSSPEKDETPLSPEKDETPLSSPEKGDRESPTRSHERKVFKRRPNPKFKEEWYQHPEFSSWLDRDPTDPTKAYCTLCNMVFQTVSIVKFRKHVKRTTHKQMVSRRRDLLKPAGGAAKPVPDVEHSMDYELDVKSPVYEDTLKENSTQTYTEPSRRPEETSVAMGLAQIVEAAAKRFSHKKQLMLSTMAIALIEEIQNS